MNSHELPAKRCRDCGEDKPVSDFWRRKQSPDGLALYCKACFGLRNHQATVARALAEGRAVRVRPVRPADVPDGSKYCVSCTQVLPLDDFVRNRSTRSGYGSYCRPCQNAKVAESIARVHGSTRHYHLKRLYGIGAVEVLQMVRDQLWRCPICSCQLTLKTAHVDHDHKTGKVRAVTCFNCNGGLGQFKDDPISLRRAAEYVEGNVWQPTKLAPGVYQMPISLPAARPSPSSSARTPRISSPADVRRRAAK